MGALPAYCTHSEAGPQMLELRPRQGPGPCLLHWALEELLVAYGWEARLPFPGPHMKPPTWPKGLLSIVRAGNWAGAAVGSAQGEMGASVNLVRLEGSSARMVSRVVWSRCDCAEMWSLEGLGLQAREEIHALKRGYESSWGTRQRARWVTGHPGARRKIFWNRSGEAERGAFQQGDAVVGTLLLRGKGGMLPGGCRCDQAEGRSLEVPCPGGQGRSWTSPAGGWMHRAGPRARGGQLAAQHLPLTHSAVGGRSLPDLRAPRVPERRLIGSPQLCQEPLIVVSQGAVRLHVGDRPLLCLPGQPRHKECHPLRLPRKAGGLEDHEPVHLHQEPC